MLARPATVIRVRPLAAALLAALALATPAAAGEISGARALDTVRALAGFGPRPAGSPNERRARDLVTARLRALGYRVVVQRVPLPQGGSSANVVAVPRGLPRVLLVAHLDGVRAGPAANDNASGVAVLLELARALRGEAGVLLAVTGAEERVETGSRSHLGAVRLLRGLSRDGRASIRLALSIDMVGVGETLHVRGLEISPNRSARLVLAQGRATYLRDNGASDHAELTRAGLPAAWLEWRDDRCWHSACDRTSRVIPARLARAGELALAAARAALATR